VPQTYRPYCVRTLSLTRPGPFSLHTKLEQSRTQQRRRAASAGACTHTKEKEGWRGLGGGRGGTCSTLLQSSAHSRSLLPGCKRDTVAALRAWKKRPPCERDGTSAWAASRRRGRRGQPPGATPGHPQRTQHFARYGTPRAPRHQAAHAACTPTPRSPRTVTRWASHLVLGFHSDITPVSLSGSQHAAHTRRRGGQKGRW
jgi:hypothetical protein